MTADRPRPEPFEQFGSTPIASPVVIAVPHAGRDYPSSLIAGSRLPQSRLQALEDRHVDQVVAHAGLADATVIVAKRARAWIDLNRDPRELDPAMLDPEPSAAMTIRSAKVRGGLGLVPRIIGGAGEIHARRLSLRDIESRILRDHAPYHAAIGDALAAARRRFGVALLVDCHSMPGLSPVQGRAAARIVVGDRFGRSAGQRYTEAALDIAETAGFAPALNAPYAGGYTLDRHADPARGIHALQIEIERALYLDDALDGPGAGLARTARWFGALIGSLTALCLQPDCSLAAE